MTNIFRDTDILIFSIKSPSISWTSSFTDSLMDDLIDCSYGKYN